MADINASMLPINGCESRSKSNSKSRFSFFNCASSSTVLFFNCSICSNVFLDISTFEAKRSKISVVICFVSCEIFFLSKSKTLTATSLLIAFSKSRMPLFLICPSLFRTLPKKAYLADIGNIIFSLMLKLLDTSFILPFISFL